MIADPVSPDLFILNRSRLKALLSENSLVVCCANALMYRSGDSSFPFRQDSDFYYLTGIDQEDCVLLLSVTEEILFLPAQDLSKEMWDGLKLSHSRASELSGINDIRNLADLDACLDKMAFNFSELRLDVFVEGGLVGELHRASEIWNRLSSKVPSIARSSLRSLTTELRVIKHPLEIEQIKRAAKITGTAFREVLEALKPGMMEYEIEAIITASFLRQGAMGHAFDPIVASGRNALILHYTNNRDICSADELLLLDFGAELNYYAADCSRTIPVKGSYSMKQREFYDACLRVFYQARGLMQPGTCMTDFHNQVGAFWEKEHIGLGLYSLREAREAAEPLWKKYYVHGTSHSLGLDVHDPFERSRSFKEGMVMTCEPGIYLNEEGLGIRLENDILITEKGPVDLLESIPIEAEEIETLMHH